MTDYRRLLSRALLLAVLIPIPPSVDAEDAPDWDAVGARAAAILSEYVRIDTQNPPGRTVEAAAFLEQLLRGFGLEIDRVYPTQEKPILVARLRGRDKLPKPIVLLNHMDVVPVDPAEWSVPPFSGEVRNGMLYGRGTVDMKGFAVMQLLALELLAVRNERPRHDVVFLAVPDEEVGGTDGVEWLARNRPDLLDVAAVWDEGGFGLSEPFSHPIFFTAVTEKKVLWLRMISRGRAGHGSRPFAQAAPLRLHYALEKILSEPPAPRLSAVTTETLRNAGAAVGGVRGFMMRNIDNPLFWLLAKPSLGADPLTSATTRDTIAITMVDAGYMPNVIPERAEAVLDCRLLPDTDQDEFIASLTRLIGEDSTTVEIIKDSRTAPPSPTDHPMFEAIKAALTLVYHQSTTTPFMSIGGTDSRYFRERGVPAYGLIPVLLSQELVATAHGIDERIPVASLGPAVRVVYEALRAL